MDTNVDVSNVIVAVTKGMNKKSLFTLPFKRS